MKFKGSKSKINSMGIKCSYLTNTRRLNSYSFLDKDKDGYVSKSEMVQAINETTSG